MANLKILSESEISVYAKPDQKVRQRVITFQVEGMAPRTIWIDRSKLPDMAWSDDNLGQKVPDEVQAQGDAIRRQAIEAEIERIKTTAQPRSI